MTHNTRIRHQHCSACSAVFAQVANNKKQLLQGDHPFVLALSDDDYSRGTDFSLLEASIGPELHWTLTSINHVLRTV